MSLFVGGRWPPDIAKTRYYPASSTSTISSLCTAGLCSAAAAHLCCNRRSCVVVWNVHVWKPSPAHLLWNVWYVTSSSCPIFQAGGWPFFVSFFQQDQVYCSFCASVVPQINYKTLPFNPFTANPVKFLHFAMLV